jgi:Peptidase family M48
MKRQILIGILITLTITSTLVAQNQCIPPEIVFNKNAFNMFSETQETWLGEVLAEDLERTFGVVRDSEATLYLNEIGQRIVKQLPPSNLKFTFTIVNVPDANAFTIAGGRIYVTRKLIALVKSSDELAAVISHELGHGIVRHSSIDMSKLFNEILKIEKVGDKQDIYDKYNRLIDNRNTKRIEISSNHEDNQQLEADRIGLYAMTAAGFDPNASIQVWKRITETKDAGTSLSNLLFGRRKPEQKRLGELIKAVNGMSASCREIKSISGDEEFRRWQSDTIIKNFRTTEKLKALAYKRQLFPLRSEVKHIEFSQNGSYIIAQDESGINVIMRNGFRLLFRIRVFGAEKAHFTLDSAHIIVHTKELRVEKWNVEGRKIISANEIFVKSGCWQTAISPNGKYLVCYSGEGNLDVIDIASNENIFRKKEFSIPSSVDAGFWNYRQQLGFETKIAEIQFSPNGEWLLVSKQIFGINKFAIVAFDFKTKLEVEISDDIKEILKRSFAFCGDTKIIGRNKDDKNAAGIFSFPEGKLLEKLSFSAQSYTKPHNGEYLFIRPINKYPVGIYDINLKKFIGSNKMNAVDGYDDYFVVESEEGKLQLFQVDKTNYKSVEKATLELSKGDFGDLNTVSVSPDFSMISASGKSRGGVWDVKSGNMKIYVRGFRGAFFDENNSVVADFPSAVGEPRATVSLNPANGNAEIINKIESRNTKQYGKYIVKLESKIEEENWKRISKNFLKNGTPDVLKEPIELVFSSISTLGQFSIINGNSVLFPEKTTINLIDSKSGKLLWSRYFGSETPSYFIDSTENTVILYWKLTDKAAKEIVKTNSKLEQQIPELGEKLGDYLVQTLDADTGNVKTETLIETGKGSFRIEGVSKTGDYLTIKDSENRILIYSISTGGILWKYFGDNVAIDSVNSIAVIENVSGQLSIYNLKTGRKTDELLFANSIEFAKFNKEGTKLFVLTTNQVCYLFNVSEFSR